MKLTESDKDKYLDEFSLLHEELANLDEDNPEVAKKIQEAIKILAPIQRELQTSAILDSPGEKSNPKDIKRLNETSTKIKEILTPQTAPKVEVLEADLETVRRGRAAAYGDSHEFKNLADRFAYIRENQQAQSLNLQAGSNNPSITTAHDTQTQRLSRAESTIPVVSVGLDEELENLTNEIRVGLAKAKPNYQQGGLTNDEIETAIDNALQEREKEYPIGSEKRTEIMWKMLDTVKDSLEQDGVKVSDNKKPGLS